MQKPCLEASLNLSKNLQASGSQIPNDLRNARYVIVILNSIVIV
jgi:hypothetical protein